MKVLVRPTRPLSLLLCSPLAKSKPSCAPAATRLSSDTTKPLMPAKHTGFGSRAPLLVPTALSLFFRITTAFLSSVPAACYPLTQRIFVKSNLPISQPNNRQHACPRQLIHARQRDTQPFRDFLSSKQPHHDFLLRPLQHSSERKKMNFSKEIS